MYNAHVQKVFAGFSELPKAEQRVLLELEKYVAEIIYHESQFIEISKPGRCDYSCLELKCDCRNCPTLRVSFDSAFGGDLDVGGLPVAANAAPFVRVVQRFGKLAR